MRGILTSLLVAAAAVLAAPSATEPALVPAAPEFQRGTPVGSAKPAATTPPSITFYSGRDCLSGGIRNTITDRLYNTCLLSTPPTYGSVRIDNPSFLYLPYIIKVSFVGNTCPTGIADIPATNTCYNINPSGGNGWLISNSGGGTF